jgi:hypothetical protein
MEGIEIISRDMLEWNVIVQDFYGARGLHDGWG